MTADVAGRPVVRADQVTLGVLVSEVPRDAVDDAVAVCGNSTTIVIACGPAGMKGGCASCTTVTADCHALDRGCCPALVDSTSGMEDLPGDWGATGPLGGRPEDRPPGP